VLQHKTMRSWAHCCLLVFFSSTTKRDNEPGVPCHLLLFFFQ
jgi:hypothetical protein